MCAILALVCFILAAFRFEPFDGFSIGWFGLALLALAMLVGPWPIGAIGIRRQGG